MTGSNETGNRRYEVDPHAIVGVVKALAESDAETAATRWVDAVRPDDPGWEAREFWGLWALTKMGWALTGPDGPTSDDTVWTFEIVDGPDTVDELPPLARLTMRWVTAGANGDIDTALALFDSAPDDDLAGLYGEVMGWVARVAVSASREGSR